MARRLVLPLVLAAGLTLFLPAGGALAGDIAGQKASVDAKLAAVQAKLAQDKKQASALDAQIGGLTSSIHALESRVGDVSSRLAVLRRDVELHRRRLDKLDALFRLQTVRYSGLRREYTLAVERLDQRLVAIYKQPDPTTIDVLLAAKSFQDVLTQLDYLGAIASQDKHVATSVATAKAQVASARARTRVARQHVRDEEQVVLGRAQQVEILRAQLVSSQGQLAGARTRKSAALEATRRQIDEEVGESQALAAASAALAAKLSSSSDGSPAVPGNAPHFIWPVSGPITSPFGMRWGTLHPGIDIGVPSDTPVHAAAAGKVVWCGWMSGYGNLVMIDHGGGYATAYGHNTRVAVSCGEEVAQGQVIAYSGCTGFCTGPHVHFEVRVDGTPVDPLGYLGG
ncbi:MAG TPA: peptidoglycan DD-metalloendopeptidase family protein [Gaiellaceae bacterium]|nr:peptidoglycan DD-metalloendopeptidase family protein [Gaiellaceae bacterium]